MFLKPNALAALLGDTPKYSETKQKALEDAKTMQAFMMNECSESGKDLPPYSFLELIGKGSFGRVYKATTTSKKPTQLVAIKVINVEAGDILYPGATDTFGDIMKEINTLKLLDTTGAKNINTLIDTHLVGHHILMVTEYCSGGSVASLMKPTGFLPERWIIPILREVAEGIHWIHKQGIIHRDIKCANVLVADTGSIQLCDFGVAAMIDTKLDKRTTVTGTLQWMAPELFDSSVSYGTEVDIWAFGSMAYEVASGRPPNATAVGDAVDLGAYLKQHRPNLEGSQYSLLLKDFVSRCMVVDPAQRPTIDIVQKHPYILNTSENYPTSSLSKLVNAYKLWETQGGMRQSLFSKGGAQPLTGHHSPSVDGEWSFTTMENSDHSRPNKVDDEAIYDVYCSRRLDYPRLHQRRPPDTKALTTPLEKVFDPNAIFNYEDDVRAFYGKLPSSPDFPPQDDSNDLTLRPLFDFDSSRNVSELLQPIDSETTKLREQPLSSGMADSDQRLTQDWTFPAILPSSAALYPAPSQFDSYDVPMGQSTQPHPAKNSATDSSIGRKTLCAPLTRESAISLIDLDASLPSDMVTDVRLSNEDSDTALAGADAKDNPFDPELLTLKGPSVNREPSLYISDELNLHSLSQCNPDIQLVGQGHDYGALGIASEPSTEHVGVFAPSIPSPPSSRVMQGIGSRDEVKDELRRMLSSLSEQLEFTAHYMETLPVRRARYSSMEQFSP